MIQWPKDLEHWSFLATAISAPTAVLALLFAGLQLMRTLKVERGRFELEVERMLAEHNQTALRLRPGGDWSRRPGAKAPEVLDPVTLEPRGPQNYEEWDAVENYMGLFEHCELLMQSGLLDPVMFRKLFGYRIENIIANPEIVLHKLVLEERYWPDFWKLIRRFEFKVPEEDSIRKLAARQTANRS